MARNNLTLGYDEVYSNRILYTGGYAGVVPTGDL